MYFALTQFKIQRCTCTQQKLSGASELRVRGTGRAEGLACRPMAAITTPACLNSQFALFPGGSAQHFLTLPPRRAMGAVGTRERGAPPGDRARLRLGRHIAPGLYHVKRT